MRRLMMILLLFSLTIPTVFAQEPYENPELGVAMNLPLGWEVRADARSLVAGSPESLAVLDGGGVPGDLVVSILFGSFVEMEITNAAELPTQLTRLVPQGVTAPPPVEVTYGNRAGWEIEYTLPDNNMHSRVGLLGLNGGRLALVRGFSDADVWEGTIPEFDEIINSLVFSLPISLANPFENIPDEDGGVLWHYQAPQPADAKPITLGGLAYDPFLLMYVAAGQRGILVLDITNGGFVSYLGPFFDDDNFADVAMSVDAKIYVANATSGDNNQIMIVNRAGQYESSFGSTGDSPGQFAPGMPRTLAVTRSSELWTVSEGHSAEPINRLYKFDRFGNLLEMIDINTINPELHNIHLDNNIAYSGLYLIGETGGLNLLDSDGAPLVTNLGAEIFAITHPVDVAIAPGDNIIIATDSEGFLEFAPSGALLDRFGTPFAGTGQFQAGETRLPGGMVVGVDGIIYFAETNPDSGFSQVQAFRFSGDGNVALPNRPGSGQGEEIGLGIDPTITGGDIEYGAVVQGIINNQNPVHKWYFEGEAGDHLRITMRDISPNGSLDTRLKLTDPNLLEIAANDDVGAAAPEGFKETDSVIDFEIRAFGFYTIEATRFGGRGEYELTLEKIAP